MKKAVLFVLMIACIGCSKPDPNDNVRALRRQYELTIDLTVNETGEARYEAKARNLSGKQELQEVTAIVRIMDKDKAVLWKKQIEINVADTGPYATANYAGVDQTPVRDNWEYFDLHLAPDNEGSGFENYREFMRVQK